MGRQTQGTALFLTALSLLVMPGILVNNLESNGLIGANPGNTCPAAETLSGNFCVSQNGNVVTLNNINPCTLNPANCNLSGQNFAVLNNCSPWTKLLALDLVGLVSTFFTSCTAAGVQTTGTGAGSGGNSTISGCTLITNYNGFAGPGSVEYQCTTPNTTPSPYNADPFLFFSGGATVLSVCGDQYDNCNAQLSNNANCGGMNGIDCGNGIPLVTLDLQCAIPTISAGVYKFQCFNLFPVAGPASIPGTVSGLSLSSILGFFLGLLGATLLTLLALGINISVGGSFLASGATSSVGSNPQGTKFAQTIGIGLLIWFPLYSEFSPWFTHGYLPIFSTGTNTFIGAVGQTGLDGNIFSGQVGIISIILSLMAFLGLYFMSQSGTAGSQ